ncbi:MAG: hypothetical protein Q9166_006504 [cf. Caloplaca sp. 2 TL-2023]
MAQGSISDKLKQSAKPVVFDVDGLVDLAHPGIEDTTRRLKKAGDNADHFANEGRGTGIADSLQDKGQVKEKCAVCTPSSPPHVITAWLHRRGNVLTSCCGAPATIIPNLEGDSDTVLDEGEYPDATSEKGQEDETDELRNSIYDPTDYNSIVEADLVPAPIYKVKNDLNSLSTGIIVGSPVLTVVTSSDDLFATLRKVFAALKDDPLSLALRVYERDGSLRLQAPSSKWLKKTSPILKPFQDFANAAVKQAVNTVGTLKGMSADELQIIDGSTEFF